MNDSAPTSYLAALIVLMFAGMAGAASTFSMYSDTGALNGGMSALAALCLPSAAIMAGRVVAITRKMQRSPIHALRRFTTAVWFALLCAFVGSTIVAVLLCTPGAIFDTGNDMLIYVAATLLGASIATTLVGGLIVELDRLRRERHDA
jgi:L-asparagine transporter-like permease